MKNRHDISFSIGFGADPSLRAADVDREATAKFLQEQHAEGRLDTDELQDRIDRCYSARTVGELEQLLGDLPRPEHPASRGPRHHWRIGLLPLLGVVIAASAVAHAGAHAVWVVIPLLFVISRVMRCYALTSRPSSPQRT